MAHLLTVRVSERCILAAGSWEERRDHNQNPHRLLAPPLPTMYEQLLAYLVAMAKAQKIHVPPALDFEEVAIATVAVCIRWGSYFAVLNDAELPLWPAASRASCLGDSEVVRLNREISAALAHWITLIDTDEQLFRTVVAAAVRFLPFPDVAIAPASDREKVRISDFFDLQQSKEALLSDIKRDWGEAFVAAKGPQVLSNVHALRALANGILLEFWRNGPIEDLHGRALSLPRPLTQRRIAPDDEQTLLAATTGRLVPLLRGLYRTITEKSAETLVEKLLPYALLFASPGDWSMTEETRACRLPEKEP